LELQRIQKQQATVAVAALGGNYHVTDGSILRRCGRCHPRSVRTDLENPEPLLAAGKLPHALLHVLEGTHCRLDEQKSGHQEKYAEHSSIFTKIRENADPEVDIACAAKQ
jgi:hypothetical protein